MAVADTRSGKVPWDIELQREAENQMKTLSLVMQRERIICVGAEKNAAHKSELQDSTR